MQLKNYSVYFFFAVLIGITAIAYVLLRPFFMPFLIAAILAYFFNPFYQRLLKLTGKEGISSALVCLLIAAIIIVPILTVLSLVVSEVQTVINNFNSNSDAIRSVVDNFIQNLPRHFNLGKNLDQQTIISMLKSLSQNFLLILQGAYEGAAGLVFATFIMFFSLFYLLMDGEKLIKKILELSPLQARHEKLLITQSNSIIRATIKGTLIIGGGQGVIGGVLFYFSGVAAPALFGILMAIASVIPPLGSMLVWLPVGVIMIILGHVHQGVLILLVGALVISSMDNFIRPKIVGKDTQMHPLMILFSTLGGIALFGILGFIIGPVIMAIFVTLWGIYALEFKAQTE